MCNTVFFLPKKLHIFAAFLTALPATVFSAPKPTAVTFPMTFEVNRGQTDADVKYVSHGGGYSLLLTSTEATLAFTQTAFVRMKFLGASRKAIIDGSEQLPGTSNYFFGNDRERWRTNVPMYRKVRYKALYPGIDVVYYGNGGQLEYDFIVAAGASLKPIVMTFDGADRIRLDAAGDLKLRTRGKEVRLHKPVAYQKRDGTRHEVSAHYVLSPGKRVKIRVGPHDPHEPLTIDPVLNFATYIGGTISDNASAVAVDSAGNTYVTGTTYSPDFRTTHALRPDFGPAVCGTSGLLGTRPVPCFHTFVAKLTPDGSAFVYLTFLGGTVSETGTGIATDSAGNAYVSGATFSPDFPLLNPLMTQGSSFVLKLNAQGSALVYSTRFGGSGYDVIHAISVDASGNVYATGGAQSADFPLMNPVPGGTCSMGAPFVAKLNPSASALVYSTCLGSGGGSAIAVDPAGNAYITGGTVSRNLVTLNAAQPSGGGGSDAFAAKLSATGALIYSTYLGDLGSAIATDASGNAYVTGSTISDNFPTVNALQPKIGSPGPVGASDAFVTKLDPAGSIVYSTYLGGIGYDAGSGIAADVFGNAYVAGTTSSSNFPIVNPIQPALGGGSDAFIVKFNAAGSAILFSTYLGGSGDDYAYGIGLNDCGNISITGITKSPDFPILRALQSTYKASSAAGSNNAFVASIIDPSSRSTHCASAQAVSFTGGVSLTSAGTSMDLSVGYGGIAASGGSVAPSGLAIFGFRKNGVLISEASVPASPLIQSGRIYAEMNGPVNTGLAIANPNDGPANISFFFTDSNGNSFGTAVTTIPAKSKISAFLDESPFNGPSAFTGSLTLNSSLPVAAVALRGLTNERSEFLMTTLPVIDLGATAASSPAVFPHFAAGGGWTTQNCSYQSRRYCSHGDLSVLGSAGKPGNDDRRWSNL